MSDNDDRSSPADPLETRVTQARKLYSDKSYRLCIDLLEASLSDAAAEGPQPLAELHLLLAKCFKGLDDLKSAILSCNSAIEHRPQWKDPYLYRSACFQAFHARLLDGDEETESEHVQRDRNESDIILWKQETGNTCPVVLPHQRLVSEIDDALSAVENGGKIFIEAGTYDVTSLFLSGKTVSVIGASTKRCILRYRKSDLGNDQIGPQSRESRLETFLICTSGTNPTLLKRLTFRNDAISPSSLKTKFLGVAGGSVQLEDCLFDGGEAGNNLDVGAVYMNAKICGPLAANFPPPRVIARFCVFERCSSVGGAFTALHSCGALQNCYFVGCGRSCVSALDSAKVSVINCELAMSDSSELAVSANSSDLTVTGCNVHGPPTASSSTTSSPYAIGISAKSVATITHNYIQQTGNGISCIDSDMKCSNNLILNCSRRHVTRHEEDHVQVSTLGLLAGITLRQKSRVTLTDNHIHRCDVGVFVADGAGPVVRENMIGPSVFAGIFVEKSAKPNIVSNKLVGSSHEAHQGTMNGLGVLLLSESGGLLGKNVFENFVVSPIMVFASCRPLLRDNLFDNVDVDDERQKSVEKSLLEQFHAEHFRSDEFFYIIDSSANEQELQDVILKGSGDS